MSSLLSDAELHGLIDGQIEVHHRADILRRAAASGTDRERISAWQSQCELIRSAFRGVDRESLPTALDLRAPARLHVIPAIRAATNVDDVPPIVVAGGQRSRWGLPLVAAAIAAGGIIATWSAGGFSLASPQSAVPDEGRRVIADVTTSVAQPLRATQAPATTIPDLSSLGYTFVAADMQPGPPSSILFRYYAADAGQLALAVSRAEGAASGAAPVALVGKALVWRAGHYSFTLTGDLRPDSMRALVPAVRALALDE